MLKSTLSHFTWPPPFTVRVSSKAHTVRLTITRAKGLVITLPKRGRRPELSGLLNLNRSWITEHLAKLTPQSQELPKAIDLLAINERWHIHYIDKPDNLPLKMQVKVNQQLIEFHGPAHLPLADYVMHLKKWLRSKAQASLIPLLETTSQQTGLHFKAVSIRAQTTRWGSCSAKKHINLNYKLLFLPMALTRHIILHELCHTAHLNHSPAFWRTLERIDPDYQALRKEMRSAQFFIPDWIE